MGEVSKTIILSYSSMLVRANGYEMIRKTNLFVCLHMSQLQYENEINSIRILGLSNYNRNQIYSHRDLFSGLI
jgi:hypothetical protein